MAGGRIHDVEVVPNAPEIVFIASASGGIWKSTSKATIWKPVFDNELVSGFGDLAISKSNTDIIYAGTGEQQNRQTFLHYVKYIFVSNQLSSYISDF